MKLTLKEIREIVKEALQNRGLESFKKSEDFKTQIENIINALSSFANKTPIGFFDSYRSEFDTDLYKSFHAFYDGIVEAHTNLFAEKPQGLQPHVGGGKKDEPIPLKKEKTEEKDNNQQVHTESKKLKEGDDSKPLTWREKAEKEFGKKGDDGEDRDIEDTGHRHNPPFGVPGFERDDAELKETKKGAKRDFASWPKEKIDSYWASLCKKYKTFDAKVKAVSGFADEPEAFIAALEKRATGKTPAENK